MLSLLTVLQLWTATHDVRALAVAGDVAWVGTTGGMLELRAEGSELWTPARGLPDGTVRALLLTGETLWIGTDRGLAQFDTARKQIVASWTTAPVHALALHEGDLWIGTWTGLLRMPSPGAAASAPAPAGSLSRITALASDGSRLYVATAGMGLHVLENGQTRRLRADSLCWSIADHDDRVWIATSRGLYQFRNARPVSNEAVRQSRTLPIADLRAVTFADGSPVVGTFGRGVWQWTGTQWQPASGASWLDEAQVQALHGQGGQLWVATTQGLSVRSGGEWTERSTFGLADNDLTSLARNGEGLWIGMFRGGLARMTDNAIEMFDEQRGLVDNRVNRLAVDAQDCLWIATDRGVMQRCSGAFTLRGFLGQHVAFVSASAQGVYAGVGADLQRWTGKDWQRVADLPTRRPQDLLHDSEGRIWAATAEGLAIQRDGSWQAMLAGPTVLPDDWTTALASWRGSMLAGTYNAGIAEINPDGVHILRSDLWVNAGAMASGDDWVAVGTLDTGLWLYDGSMWRNLTTVEGLPDDDVTDVLVENDGSLLVATRGGLARLGPPR